MLELPLFSIEELGTVTGRDGTIFRLVAGLDETLVQSLKEHSLNEADAELKTQTSDRVRFGEGSYEEWYAKGRLPFALVASDGALAALIWIGASTPPFETTVPDVFDTIAFRSYLPHRGSGLMTPFARFVLEYYERHTSNRTLWLETNPGNEAGRALYTKLSFVERGQTPTGRTVMVRE